MSSIANARDDQKASKLSFVAPRPTGLFRKKGVVVIDDDEAFCQLMETVARARGIPLETFMALEEMPSFATLNDYDVAVIDFNLKAFNGLEIAEYVDVFFRDLPVMIVSIDEVETSGTRRWPSCIRRFLNKAFGPFAILQRSIDILSEHRQEKDGVAGAKPVRSVASNMH